MAADAVLSSLAPAIAPVRTAPLRETADSGYSDRLARRLFDPPRPTRRTEPEQSADRPASVEPPVRSDRSERPGAVREGRQALQSDDTDSIAPRLADEPSPETDDELTLADKPAAAGEVVPDATGEATHDAAPEMDAADTTEAAQPVTNAADVVRTPAVPWGETNASVVDGTIVPDSADDATAKPLADPVAPASFPSPSPVAVATDVASPSATTKPALAPPPPAGLGDVLSTTETLPSRPADATAPPPDAAQAAVGPSPGSDAVGTTLPAQLPVEKAGGTGVGMPDGKNSVTAPQALNADESPAASLNESLVETDDALLRQPSGASQPSGETRPANEGTPVRPLAQSIPGPSDAEAASDITTVPAIGPKGAGKVATSTVPGEEAPSETAGAGHDVSAAAAELSDHKLANIAGRELLGPTAVEAAASAETPSADIKLDVTAAKSEATQPVRSDISAADGLRPPPVSSTSAGPATRGHALESAGRSAVVTPESLPDHAAAALRAAASFDRPIRIRLSPAELGTLRVEVSRQDGGVSARFEVTTTAAHSALSDHLSALRESLGRTGVPVERIEIRIAEPQSDDGRRDDRHGSGGGRDGQPDGGRQQRHGDERRQAPENENHSTDAADHGIEPSPDEPLRDSGPSRRSETDLLDIQV